MTIATKLAKRQTRRINRIRNQIRRSANGRPRLSVFRSNNHMYAQIIVPTGGRVLATASTLDDSLRGGKTGNIEAAAKVGTLIAERAKAIGVTRVAFDRAG